MLIVDGDHSKEGFIADLIHFSNLTNLSRNVVVIDDLETETLSFFQMYQVLNFPIDHNRFFHLDAVRACRKFHNIFWSLSENGMAYEFQRAEYDWISSLGIGRYHSAEL
jgi:hypothetical protein